MIDRGAGWWMQTHRTAAWWARVLAPVTAAGWYYATGGGLVSGLAASTAFFALLWAAAGMQTAALEYELELERDEVSEA